MTLSNKAVDETVDWGSEFGLSLPLSRVICSDNNTKAALNMAIWKYQHPEDCFVWDAVDDLDKVKKKKKEDGLRVIDQLEPVQFAKQ